MMEKILKGECKKIEKKRKGAGKRGGWRNFSGLIWLTGSGEGKRHFLKSGQRAFCLIGVVRERE